MKNSHLAFRRKVQNIFILTNRWTGHEDFIISNFVAWGITMFTLKSREGGRGEQWEKNKINEYTKHLYTLMCNRSIYFSFITLYTITYYNIFIITAANGN